jgi:hypothetical protein
LGMIPQLNFLDFGFPEMFPPSTQKVPMIFHSSSFNFPMGS